MARNIAIGGKGWHNYLSEIPDLHHIHSFAAHQAYEDYRLADRIFVNEQSDWTDSDASPPYLAIDILMELRRGDVRCPIFYCTFNTLSVLLDTEYPAYQLLRLTAQHPLIALPALIIDTKEYQEAAFASPELLLDALLYLTKPEGEIKEVLHNLKNKYPVAKNSFVNAANRLNKIIPESQRTALQVIINELEQELENIQPDLSVADKINVAGPKIQALLPGKNSGPIQTGRPWRVLFIDDQPEHGEEIRTEFLRNGIQCELAHSAQEAYHILQQDLLPPSPETPDAKLVNSITVVITDLRFYEKDRCWQAQQGYDMISHIHRELPNFVAFVVLTASRHGLEELRRSLRQVRWRGFVKDNIFGDKSGIGFSMLADHVIQEGEEIFSAIDTIPRSSIWQRGWKNKFTRPFKEYYRQFRLSPRYAQLEAAISRWAVEYVREAELVKDRFHKDKTEVEVTSFSPEFMAGISAKLSEDQVLDKFVVKLVGRRIAIALTEKGWSAGEITAILKQKKFDTYADIDTQLLNSYLGLSSAVKSEIPSGLLVEERTWLRENYNYSRHLTDDYLFNELSRILSEFQNRLRDTRCDDDFLETETELLRGGAPIRQNLATCYSLCQQFGKDDEMLRIVRSILDKPEHREAVRRNQLRNWPQNS